MKQVLLLIVLLIGFIEASILKFQPNNIIKGLVEEFEQIKEEKKETVGKKPWFCHDLGCPEFKVIENNTEYQLREYEATSWMTTSLTGVSFEPAQYTMFMKLFKYIDGNNEKKEKIAMTCPVVVRIIPGAGPNCESNFTMSFFNVPGNTPPKPNDKDVTVTKLPKLRAYVRSFSGFTTSFKSWRKEAQALIKALPDSAKYITEFYYTGGYDAPFKLTGRHNEIWFIAK